MSGSLRAWRTKVCISQADPTSSPPPDPRGSSPTAVFASPEPVQYRKVVALCPRLKQLIMDVGIRPPAKAKVNKPSIGVRVLRTLFDNSPPTYTSSKGQAAAAAAAAAREEQRRQQQQQLQRAEGYLKNSGRPPAPRRPSEEITYKQSDSPLQAIDRLAEKNGRFPPNMMKSGRKASYFSSDMSENQSSFGSYDEAHSSASTESDLSFHRGHDAECRNMNQSTVRDQDDFEYEHGISYVPQIESHVLEDTQTGKSAQRLEALKHEIERLRFENLVLKQRGTVVNHHPDDSDISRASSVTEISNVEEPSDGWIFYTAEYHPPSVGTANVTRHQQQPNGYCRSEITRPHTGERQFRGEHAAKALHTGHASPSDNVSMVTDGSRASSRHNSGQLADNEPHSGLTTRHNSGMRSDHEEYPSMMSLDGSRHTSGPIVVDRQELYGLTLNSRDSSRNNSGMLVDPDEKGRMTPLSRSRENSRHNSGMQVDREGRGFSPGIVSPRISVEKLLAVGLPTSNNIRTISKEETYPHQRVYAAEQHLVEPDIWDYPSKHSGNKYEEYEDSAEETAAQVQNQRRNNGGHESSHRNSSPLPNHRRNYDAYEVPSRATTPQPNFVNQYEEYGGGSYGGRTATSSPSHLVLPKSKRTVKQNSKEDLSDSAFYLQHSADVRSMITAPGSRSSPSQNNEELRQFLQLQQEEVQQHSLSMDSSQSNSVPRSRSTHSQMSTEEASAVQNQHQSTLERLMISQQRRQNMSGTSTPPGSSKSVTTSPDQQESRNSRQMHSKSAYRR